MKSPSLIGWQTLLADLSLILFMVTGAALASSRGNHPGVGITAPAFNSGARASAPLAVWRAGGGVPLRRWLAVQQPDARQQLTITAHYRPGNFVMVLGRIDELARQAGTLGMAARVIVEPDALAPTEAITVSLAYDQPPAASPGAVPPTSAPKRRKPSGTWLAR